MISAKVFVSIIFFILIIRYITPAEAQEKTEISNRQISRTFLVTDSVFYTSSLKNLKTGKEFINGRGHEFSFYVNNEPIGTEMFSCKSIHREEAPDEQMLTVELTGRQNSDARGIVIHITYWLYGNLPVVRKQISVKNTNPGEVAITGLDIENIMLDVSGVHFSEIHAAYGQNFETAPYTGNYNDAALLMYDPRISQGVILGNEAVSVMKRTEIYTSGFPVVQIGLSGPAGNFPFKVFLREGDVFESPKTFIFLAQAPSWQLAFEGQFSDFIRNHLGIRFFRLKDPPLLIYNTWRPFRTNIDDLKIRAAANALEGSGTDLFIIDCGWYDKMGNYRPDPKKFPDGLEPVCQYIRDRKMKVGLWFSIATANMESDVVKAHPEWTIKGSDGNPVLLHDRSGSTLGEKSYTMSMASPWYDYIYEIISGYIRTCGLSYIKLDLAAAIGSYQPDPAISGDYEGGGVKAYKDRESSYWMIFKKTLDFCDALHKEFPGLLIDYTYETHGRHNGVDYALLQHAEYDWLTNYEQDAPAGPLSIRQMRFRRAGTMPVSALLIGNQNMVEQTKALTEYTYLSVVSATGILVGDVRDMDVETKTWYRKWNNWFRSMNDNFQFTRFYQVGEIFDFPTMENWDGCYRFNTEKEGGVIFIFRNKSLDTDRRFRIHCVNPASGYRIYNPMNKEEIYYYSGKDLIENGIKVSLQFPFSAMVFGIEKEVLK